MSFVSLSESKGNITEAGHMSQSVVNTGDMSDMQTGSIPYNTPLPLFKSEHVMNKLTNIQYKGPCRVRAV